MRDLPRKHRNALRDFYMLEDDDATVCARNGLSLIAWRELKGQVDSLFYGHQRDTAANHRRSVRAGKNCTFWLVYESKPVEFPLNRIPDRVNELISLQASNMARTTGSQVSLNTRSHIGVKSAHHEPFKFVVTPGRVAGAAARQTALGPHSCFLYRPFARKFEYGGDSPAN
jgi:hypothetical protein